MDVLGLEDLECNYEKLKNFVKMAKARKPKFEGPKSNFKKTCNQQWPTSTCQRRNWPRGTHEGGSGTPLGQVMADNGHRAGRISRKIRPRIRSDCRNMQVGLDGRIRLLQVDLGRV